MWRQAWDNGTDIQNLEASRPHGLPAKETCKVVAPQHRFPSDSQWGTTG